MIDRRTLLLAMAGSLLFPYSGPARAQLAGCDWRSFIEAMQALSTRDAAGTLAPEQLAEQGLQAMRDLDIDSADFHAAVSNAWESGNRFWLWQRLVRNGSLQGGILEIEQGHDVPLHDHPGATGLLRIITGRLEVWQFDRSGSADFADTGDRQTLLLVSRRTLGPGDTAALLPEHGNIHALRALTPQCRMLDMFIPPYNRKQRSWYEPLNTAWHDEQLIDCRRIDEKDYYLT